MSRFAMRGLVMAYWVVIVTAAGSASAVAASRESPPPGLPTASTASVATSPVQPDQPISALLRDRRRASGVAPCRLAADAARLQLDDECLTAQRRVGPRDRRPGQVVSA